MKSKQLFKNKKTNGRACGIDHIRKESLKSCDTAIKVLIVNLSNMILKTSLIPEQWCIDIIILLYKTKGLLFNYDILYMGITLLICMGKLFTAVLNGRMTRDLDAIGGYRWWASWFTSWPKGYCRCLRLSVCPSVRNNNILHVKTYDKRETFKLKIVSISGNIYIHRTPAYGIYSSQIIRYARSCSKEQDLI